MDRDSRFELCNFARATGNKLGGNVLLEPAAAMLHMLSLLNVSCLMRFIAKIPGKSNFLGGQFNVPGEPTLSLNGDGRTEFTKR